jgi:heme exporter protein C
MPFSGQLLPWVAWPTALLLAAGLMLALFVAPPDHQQGESIRIIFIHASAAWMSMFYATVAGASAVALIWSHPLADVAAAEAAPLGAAFILICLVTGLPWGKPMWGTYWVWDACLTSEMVFFFLYLAYLALINAFDDPTRGARAGAILALVGIVTQPIIRFSVDWWITLHQPASVMRLGGRTVDISMLVPLFVMATAFTLFFVTVLLLRMRAAIIGRKLRALRQIQVERLERFVALPREAPGIRPIAAPS